MLFPDEGLIPERVGWTESGGRMGHKGQGGMWGGGTPQVRASLGGTSSERNGARILLQGAEEPGSSLLVFAHVENLLQRVLQFSWRLWK